MTFLQFDNAPLRITRESRATKQNNYIINLTKTQQFSSKMAEDQKSLKLFEKKKNTICENVKRNPGKISNE